MRWFVPFVRLQRYVKYLEISDFVPFIIVCRPKKAACCLHAGARAVAHGAVARWQQARSKRLAGRLCAGSKEAEGQLL
jgi:hypothetical protein